MPRSLTPYISTNLHPVIVIGSCLQGFSSMGFEDTYFLLSLLELGVFEARVSPFSSFVSPVTVLDSLSPISYTDISKSFF